MMLFRSLFRSDLVDVTEVICPGGPDHPGEESSAADLLLFPRVGAYTFARSHRESWQADATQVLFLNRDEGYRVHHARPTGDRTTVIRVESATLDRLLGERGARPTGGRVFQAIAGPTGPATDLALRSLVRTLERAIADEADVDRLLVEEVALTVVGDAVASTPDGQARIPRAAARRARVRAIQRVQDAIVADPAAPASLSSLARIAGMSPTHLSRVFHATVGLPVHQYRRRLRLRAALERLLAGERDLTGLALDLGFADHSHLTASMREELGLAPSAIRAGRVARSAARLAPRSDLAERARIS